MISIILIHYNTPDPLAQTLAAFSSLGEAASGEYELIVVDNASLGHLALPLQDLFPKANYILRSQNSGFGIAANAGANKAQGDSLLFLNGDCFLHPGQRHQIHQVAGELKETGAIGFRQATPEGWPQLTFGRFPTFLNELKRHRWQKALDSQKADWAAEKINRMGDRPIEVDWVSGSCLWMPRKIFEQAGGFDEKFFMYFEDIDLCQRVKRLGYKVYYAPEPEILHLHGASAEKSPEKAQIAYRQSQLYFARKHRGLLGAGLTRSYILARSALELFVATLRGDSKRKATATKIFAAMLRK